MNGPCEEFHDNGQLRLSGVYKNGQKIGYWKSFSPDGQMLSKEHYVAGARDGLSESFHLYNGKGHPLGGGPLPSSKGRYEKGEKVGCWEEFYYNGRLKRKAHYIDGKREGISEYFYENGAPGQKEIYKNDQIVKQKQPMF